jgi:hypothetical protein
MTKLPILSACTGHHRVLERRKTKIEGEPDISVPEAPILTKDRQISGLEATASSQDAMSQRQTALEGTTILGKSFEKKETPQKQG